MLNAAYGKINGPATVTALLDDKPMPVSLVGTQAAQWRASLELAPGTHQLRATADHPSGLFTASATNWFTNNVAFERAVATYDALGQITQLVWTNSAGQTIRSQTFTWDGPGRLLKASERDSGTNGFDWDAGYDGLNRRLRTITTPVTNNVTNVTSQVFIDQYYDPQVEFLEVGVSINGITTWKVYGPDANGTYGGLNGVGGFEAIVPAADLFCPVIGDALGNVHAVYDPSHAGLFWNSSRVTAYGAIPGCHPPPLGQGGNIVSASAYRGKWSDVHGHLNLGMGYLAWDNGHFLSTDPLGHDAG